MNNLSKFRVARYQPNQKVKLKLTASEVKIISEVLFNEGHFSITDKILDQMCGNHSVEWIVK